MQSFPLALLSLIKLFLSQSCPSILPFTLTIIMKSTPSTKRSGFTLIELLTGIAIIGILAAVLFPGVQGVMKKAKQSTASTKLRNIIQATISLHDGKKFIKQTNCLLSLLKTTLVSWPTVLG